MSAHSSLPSSEELTKATELGTESGSCRSLVFQALSYGTAWNQDSSLEDRCRETSKVLSDAWEECPAMEDVLVDGLWLCSSMVGSSPDNAKSVDALIKIVKSLAQVPNRTDFWTKLQCNLVPSLLDASGLVSEQELLKKLKMHNTQVHYKQQKYNLLQEESEGYSKVLNFFVTGCHHDGDPECHKRRLRQLIGVFELDPNRVLDLLLDVLEARLYPLENTIARRQEPRSGKPPRHDPLIDWLVDLVKDFPSDKLPPLIGFKLNGEEEGSDSSWRLLKTISFLAARGVLDLNTMMKDYLPPVEQTIQGAHKIFWMKQKGRMQALGRSSLSGRTKEDPKQAELKERFEKLLVPLETSPAIRILLIFLEWKEWDIVENIFSMETLSKLCTILPAKFGFALCDLAQDRVSEFCRSTVLTVDLCGNSPPRFSDGLGKAKEITLDQVVLEISSPLLCTIQSGCIASRPVLYCQLCRLFRSILESEKSQKPYELSERTYTFFKAFLVPSLSLFTSNPAVSTELWSVLKLLSYSTRYRLYGDWRGAGLGLEGMGSVMTTKGKSLANVESEINAGKAIKYALKRLSKDNIRDMSRQLAKVSHSNSLVVFTTILNQIESYDNMVEVMVESQRFVNALGLDVLGYCILSRLSGMAGGVNRSRLKDDGVNVSQWLQSLEAFAGALYKRCPYVEFRGMLCYLMRRLRDGNVMELGMLRTLLKVAGGYTFADYSPASSLNATQLEGRAGSITLKRETMSFGIFEEVNFRASSRIRDVLQSDGFGVTMLILVAQARSSILFDTSTNEPKPVKLIGNLYDSCQVVLCILLEFLTNALDSRERDNGTKAALTKYAESLPTLTELHASYGFDAASAWALCRPLARAATVPGSKRGENGVESALSSRLKLFALNDETREGYKGMFPAAMWSVISPVLFETFFTKNLYDLFNPEGVYKAETNRLNKEIERIQQRQKSGVASSLHGGAGNQKNEDDDIARLKSVSSTLSMDAVKQKEHVAAVQEDIESKKDTFFPSKEDSRHAVNSFLANCIYPRSMQGPDDAMYCAQFALLLHRLDTPGFSMMEYIDSLVSMATGSLVCVTEGEASHLAILLWETWKVVNKWRYDERAYEREVLGKTCAYIEGQTNTPGEEDTSVSYKHFTSLFDKWQVTLGNALIGCLQSPEYMHTRACLLVLTRIVEVFPTQPKLGNKLLEVLTPLQDESISRPDIRASASAYSMMLLKARDEGRWTEEDAADVKARVEKEKAAAEERKKKIAEQFQEMKRESEKITEEIGSRDGPRDRHDRRRTEFDSRSLTHVESPYRTKTSPISHPGENGAGSRTTNVRAESGEISRTRRGETSYVRSSPPRDSDIGRERERGATEERGRVSQLGRSGENQQGSDVRRRDGATSIRDDTRGLGARWSRGDVQLENRGRGSKRSRPSSPETGNEGTRNDRVGDGRDVDRDSRLSKRQRTAGSSGLVDYDAKRASSPPRRRGSPPPSRRRGTRR